LWYIRVRVWYMGKRTSVYLRSAIADLVERAGSPPLAALIEEAAYARLKAAGREDELPGMREIKGGLALAEVWQLIKAADLAMRDEGVLHDVRARVANRLIYGDPYGPS
jgi:hypothetical protein